MAKDQTPDVKRNAGAFKLKYILTEPGTSSKKNGKNSNPNKVFEDNPDDPVLLHQVN